VPFFISPGEDVEQIKSAKIGEMECVLKYNTKDVTIQKPTQKFPPIKEFLEGVTNKLGKKCIDSSKDGWLYKVCLGEQIIQSLPGSSSENSLGTFLGFVKSKHGKEEVEQKYEGGSPTGCPQDSPRSSLVSFACGDQLRIDSITEPSVCLYSFIVSLPEVCGHPAFPQASRGSSDQSWILEITKNEEQGHECSARITGFGISSNFPFSSFSSSFSSVEKIDSFAARGSNRIIVDPANINEIQGGIQISSQTLNYVEIYSSGNL